MASVCPPVGSTQVEWVQVGPGEITTTYIASGTYPNCDGAVQSVVVKNNSPTVKWKIFLPAGDDVAQRTIRVNPLQTRTFGRTQCVNAGYGAMAKLRGLLITLDTN